MAHKTPTRIDRFMFAHQPWSIGAVVIPATAAIKIGRAVKSRVRPETTTVWCSPAEHDAIVQRVAEQVRRWAALPAEGRPQLRTNRSATSSFSLRHADKSGAQTVDVGELRHVIELDEKAQTVRIEPQATVGEVTDALAKHGWMLEATLEMEGASLGGLALSQGLTTHSHQCGFVHDTVTEWEFVTGQGEVLVANAEQNSDVFVTAGMSQGSLGVLTALTLRVVPTTKEVLITYETVDDLDQLANVMMKRMADPDIDFAEAIAFSAEHAVVVTGVGLSDEEAARRAAEGTPRNNQGDWRKPWYFTHAEVQPDGTQELMPLRDYLMRHDRSMCMTMEYTFPPGNSAFFRNTLGWVNPPELSFLKGIQGPAIRQLVITEQIYQDIAVPAVRYAELLRHVDAELGIYPLLVYPCVWRDRGGLQRHPEGGARGTATSPRETVYLNVGIYGRPTKPGGSMISRVRRLLALARSMGGYQHTYCDVLQTREEFEQQLDHTKLREVRERIGSQLLPEPYDKVRCELPWEDWA